MESAVFEAKVVRRLVVRVRCGDVPGDLAGHIIATGGDHRRDEEGAHVLEIPLTTEAERLLAEEVLERHALRPIDLHFEVPGRFSSLPVDFKRVRVTDGAKGDLLSQALRSVHAHLREAMEAGLVPSAETTAASVAASNRRIEEDIATLERLKARLEGHGLDHASSWVDDRLHRLRVAQRVAERIDPDIHSSTRYESVIREGVSAIEAFLRDVP